MLQQRTEQMQSKRLVKIDDQIEPRFTTDDAGNEILHLTFSEALNELLLFIGTPNSTGALN